jgi:hypothetical protein
MWYRYLALVSLLVCSIKTVLGDAHLRQRRELSEEEATSWKDRVKEKGESVFQEKKRAAIRAACYKDWKPGCRRIVEWAKKTGRIKGAEQQELIDFARKTLEAAERNGDLISSTHEEKEDETKQKSKNAVPLVDGDMSFDPDQSPN